MKVNELAQRIGAQVVGDGSVQVSSVATLEQAQPGQVSFLANPKYADALETTNASAVIAAMPVACERMTLLKTADPYFALRQAVIALHGFRRHPHEGVHRAAHVDATAKIGPGTIIYPGVFVGPRARIGRDCIIYPNAVIYDECTLGDRVTVHACAVIGQDGFGYATHKGEHHKIPQVGNVIIEDDVEIGSNCVIERASLGSTIIGKGTKMDSLVAVGHNTRVGPHGLLVAQVGIAGSVTIGHHATIAGQSGIAGHLKIGDNVTIAAQAGVINDVPDQTVMMGVPAMPASQARRVYALFLQLPELIERIKELEQKVEELSMENDQSPNPNDQ